MHYSFEFEINNLVLEIIKHGRLKTGVTVVSPLWTTYLTVILRMNRMGLVEGQVSRCDELYLLF